MGGGAGGGGGAVSILPNMQQLGHNKSLPTQLAT